MLTPRDITSLTEYYVYRTQGEFMILNAPFEDVYRDTHTPELIGIFMTQQAMYDWLAGSVQDKPNRQSIINSFLAAHQEFVRNQETL